MNDLISRQAAIDVLLRTSYIAAEDRLISVAVIKALPTAQPQRMRGRWVEVTDGTCIWKVCDQCGEKPLWNEWRTDRCESDFCPNCGADMREEQDG